MWTIIDGFISGLFWFSVVFFVLVVIQACTQAWKDRGSE